MRGRKEKEARGEDTSVAMFVLVDCAVCFHKYIGVHTQSDSARVTRLWRHIFAWCEVTKGLTLNEKPGS